MMIGSMNKVTLAGYVGKDPVIRTTQLGKETVSFSLATKERINGQDRTEWHRVVVINEGLVKLIKDHVTQGSSLIVEGQNKTREYTDKQGVKRSVTEVVVVPYTGIVTLFGGKK
ncbi:single-stranded DNA-binding protein [Commensalibacter intestini]|nr:single-stranded DNA-binding protein [Commensalibacter intestini]